MRRKGGVAHGDGGPAGKRSGEERFEEGETAGFFAGPGDGRGGRTRDAAGAHRARDGGRRGRRGAGAGAAAGGGGRLLSKGEGAAAVTGEIHVLGVVAAHLHVSAQTDGTLTFSCDGDVPQIDIPVVVILLG